MAAVDPQFAQWLQEEGLWAVSEDAIATARWGNDAITSERMTSIAFKADAETESGRQLAFMAGPAVPERHLIPGEWRQFRGQVITVTIDQLGYGEGLDVFLLAAEDDKATGLSAVTVLRRL
jgi:hypothetical protein